MPAEQFVINIITTGDKEAVAAQGRVAASSREMGAAAKGASTASGAAATSSAQKWTNAGATATAAGKKLNRGLTLPILAVGAVTGKMAIDFEKSMRNVNSIAQLPEPQFQKLNDTVLHMAGKVAQAPITLSEGLYDLVSSGFKANEAVTVLDASARAATAGLTTTEVSTKAVAAALNAYHLPASKAKAISDDLFQTVNLGVVTFDELASTIGYVLPAASTMGVDLKQVGASISTLTKEGQSSSNAVTNINAALTAFIKPSKAMHNVLGELGYETSKQIINQKGFQGALEEVTTAVGGGEEAIGELFPNVRAMRAVFGLTGDAAKGAGKDLQGFQSDTGATAKVLHEQQKSLSFQWNELKAEASELGIEVGKKLIPEIRDLAGGVMGVVHWFGNLPEGVQSSTLKLLAFGAAMGPILRIGGTFATMIGGIAKGFTVIKGASIVGDISAALSMSGERRAALGMVGGDMAGTLMGGLTKALPIAAAGAGLGNIVYSATQGDWKEAGFKGGGALIGGIAGAFLGKSPQAAMLGAGAGSLIGGLVGNLFDTGSTESAFKKRNQETIRSAIAGQRDLIRSSHQVEKAERSLQRTGGQQADVARRLRATQERLNAARKGGDIARVRHEEAQLNELKAKQIRLTHQQWHEENLLHAAKVKNETDARRARTVEVALVKTRDAQLEQAKKRERSARQEFEDAVLHNKPLKEQNEREKELIDAQKRRKGATEKLGAAEKELGGTMKEISGKFGKDFADQLRQQIPLWRSTAAQISRGRDAIHALAPSFNTLSGAISHYKTRQDNAKESSEKSATSLRHFGGAAQEAGQKVKTAKVEVVSGFTGMETKSTSFLSALNVKSPFTAPAKAGGGIMEVQGAGRHDTVPVTHRDVAAMVAPGEMLAVINRHQAPLLNQAVANEYGVNGLGGFFNTFDRPHHMAIGGLMEPRIRSGGSFRGAEQKDVHRGFEAAVKYLKAHSEPQRVQHMLTFAEAQAAKGYPYVFGGGHGSFAGPYDCSGYVSAILHAGNFLSTPMSVQQGSGLYTLGQPGPGKWFTWGVRGSSGANAHTMMGIKDLSKGWKYFESGGSGGGAHTTSGWDGSFSFRHMPGFAKGGILPPRGVQDAVARWGPKQATDPRSPHFIGWGYARGGRIGTGTAGVPRFSTGGPVPPKGGELVGASYYGGPTDGVSGTVGAAGVSLPGTMSFAELAMGHALGGLNFHDKLTVSYNGKSVVAEKLDVGSGGDAVNGKNRAIDLWYETANAIHMPGTAVVRVAPASGSGATKEEKVPATFHGAQTKSIDFPDVPNSLHGVNKEIGKWTARLATYRKAVKAAKGKPKLEQALSHNVTAIQGWLKKLRRERSLLRRKAAEKKASRKLARKLGQITGAERHMEEAERTYNMADEEAQQIVDLEPQAPDIPPIPGKADERERYALEKEAEKTERRYVQEYSDYIEQQERPAYGRALEALAAWRNITIGGELTADRLETGWEKEVRSIDNDIDAINTLTDKVTKDRADWKHDHPHAKHLPKWLREEIQKMHQERARLPVLRYRDRETRKVLGEGREAFYKDRKNPVEPPSAPMPTSGSIEEVLVGIQGTHLWPDFHAQLPAGALAPPRHPGAYGGTIWDLDGTIEELGLKIKQVQAGVNEVEEPTFGPDASESERLQLVEEENLQLKKNELVHLAQVPVLGNFLGSYGKGGTLPEDGLYYGHAGEKITQRDQARDDGGVTVVEPHVHLHGTLSGREEEIDARVELRFRNEARKVGQARGTPSVAGRRASLGRRGT